MYDVFYTGNSESVAHTTEFKYYADGTLMQTIPLNPDQTPAIGVTTEYYDPASRQHWTQVDGVAGENGNTDQTLTIESTYNLAGVLTATINQLLDVTSTTGVSGDKRYQPVIEPAVQFGDNSYDTKSTVNRDSFGQSIHTNGPVASVADGIVTNSFDTLGYWKGSRQNSAASNAIETETNAAGDVLIQREKRFTLGVADNETYTTTYKYDSLGRLRQVTDPLANVESGATPAKVDYAYDTDIGATKVTTTSRLNVVSYQWYDAAGQLSRTENAQGGVTNYRYDKAGRLMGQISTPSQAAVSSSITEYQYDQRGRLRNTIVLLQPNIVGPPDPNGPQLKTHAAVDYFDHGDSTGDGWNVIAFVTLAGDGLGTDPATHQYHSSRSRFDSLGNPLLVQAPDPGPAANDVPTTAYSYQYSSGEKEVVTRLFPAENHAGSGVPVSTDVTQERKSRDTYNPVGALLKSERWDVALGGTTPSYWLNAENDYHQQTGKLIASRDAVGNQTDYGYDSLTGMVNRIEKPNGELTEFEYDSAGNRTRLVYSGAPVGGTAAGTGDTHWQYDALGRVKSEGVSGVTTPRTWTYNGLETVFLAPRRSPPLWAPSTQILCRAR